MKIVRKCRRPLAAGGLMLAMSIPGVASAGQILDLEAFSANSSHSDPLVVSYAGGVSGTAVLDNFLDRDITFFDSNYILPSRVFCFEKQFGCGMTGAIYFSTVIQDLTFMVEQTSEISNVRAEIYNGSTLVSSLYWNDITGPATPGKTRLYDFTGLGPITSLVLNSQGDIALYGDFAFAEYSASVPEPSALLLCLLGVTGLAVQRRAVAGRNRADHPNG